MPGVSFVQGCVSALGLNLIFLSVPGLIYLTNKEALTVLCSVVKHAGAARARKKCRGKHEPIGECFSLLLECSSRFLKALQQNRAQSRLFYLFYDKKQVIFFKNSTLFSKRALLVVN